MIILKNNLEFDFSTEHRIRIGIVSSTQRQPKRGEHETDASNSHLITEGRFDCQPRLMGLTPRLSQKIEQPNSR